MHFLALNLLTAFALIQIGCGNGTLSPSAPRAIFANDDRTAVPHSYGVIGMYGDGCTAFAVGPRLIMTAAHCTFQERELSWTPNGSSEKIATTLLERGMKASSRGRYLYGAEVMNDWAIIKLDHPITKWIDIHTHVDASAVVSLAGYSYDKKGATIHKGCRVQSIRSGIISHDCDMRAGASGGPMLMKVGQGWRFVGIQSTENCFGSDCQHDHWSERNSNRACKMSADLEAKVGRYRAIFDR